MKKSALFTVLSLCLCVSLLLSGCGGTAAPSDTPSPSGTSTPSATTTAPTTAPTAGPMTARGITDSELEAIENFINEKENNGFVSYHFYANPQEMDLGIILYDGADRGIRLKDFPQEEHQYLLDYFKRDKFNTGCMKVTRKDVEELLLQKTGIALDPFELTATRFAYVEKYDAFYTMISDSNYEEFDLTGGFVQENGVDTVYTVYYENTYYNREIQLKLRKVEGGYHFISSTLANITPGKLNAEDLQKLQTFLQKKSTAAFLGPNEYENTNSIDLLKVFDDGAGLTMIHPFENWSDDLKMSLLGTTDWTNEDIQAFGINPMEANDLLKKYTNRDLTRDFAQKLSVGSYSGGETLLECPGYGYYFVFCNNPPAPYVAHVLEAEIDAGGTLTVRYSDGTENGAVYEAEIFIRYQNSKYSPSSHRFDSNKRIR